jgi:hypothetical protein
VLAAFLLGLAPVKADPPVAKPLEKGKPVVVPFEVLPSGHITVQVKVNGKGPYKLIFDTGAPITLMNNKVAKEAGLLKGVTRPLISLFGAMGDVKVAEMEVGGQKIENSVAIVMDHPTVEAISKAFGPIEGIVGFPFFARFKMTLDYQAKKMTFVPSGFDPPDVMGSMQKALLSGLGGDAPTILTTSATWGLTVHKKSGDEEAGVTVTKVLAGGPASRAGLKEGDRLLTLDGRWTDSVADTFRAAGAVKPGTPAVAVVKRDGKEVKLTIKPVPGL